MLNWNPGLEYYLTSSMAAHLVAGYGIETGASYLGEPRHKSTRFWAWGSGLPHTVHEDHGVELSGRDYLSLQHLIDAFSTLRGKNGGGLGGMEASTKAESSSGDGALSLVMDMPLEVVYEIFSHLQPLDLLLLSRTTRRLRQVLLSREVRFVWTASLANVRGLPSCPPDLTEPQYANLAFDDHCHFCSKKDVKDIYWACRVRCCSSCVTEHFMSYDELDCWIPEQVYIQKPGSVFPYIVINRCHVNKPTRTLYHIETAKKYLNELDVIVATRDEDALTTWTKSKKLTQSMKLTHATLCEHWNSYWASHTSSNSFNQTPLFDIAVTTALSAVLMYLWRGKLF